MVLGGDDGDGRWGMSATFNYDDEPDLGTSLDPVAYVYDAKTFPRDDVHQPEWLKQRIAEGRARLAARGE